MERIRNFDNVVVGDKFMVGKGFGWSRGVDYYTEVECTKVTPKQCTIGGNNYRKADGVGIGTYVDVFRIDPKVIKSSQTFLKAKKLTGFDFNSLNDEAIENIWRLTKSCLK